jgi:hypothetical protein
MNFIQRACEAIGLRLDAKFTATLEKEIEHVKTMTYDIVYPELKARTFIPVDNSADPGAETITYRQWDEFGMAQIISNYADDLPLIDALVEEFSQRVHSIGAAYQWSIQDLRRSAMSGSRLDQRKARAARRSIEMRIDEIGATGKANAGLTGIANNANVSLVSPTTGTWSGATGEQIIADMNKHVNSIVNATKEAFIPDTLIYATTLYTLISTKRISTTGDTHTTVLQAFLQSNPFITSVGSWHKLATADAAGTGPRAICYKRDPEVLTFEIPQEFEQFPPQPKNLAFQVPCHARTAGVIVYYPVAMAYMDGL